MNKLPPLSIKVLCSTGMQTVITALAPDYERATGNRLIASFDAATALQYRIEQGETCDVTILTKPAIDDLVKQNKIMGYSRRDLARSLIGVAILAGAPRPDITSVEAFKHTLLSAKSVAYTSAGASGMYVAHLIDELGIADAIRPKSKRPAGGYAAELIIKGEAEIAVQNISELIAVPGVELAGALPPALQQPTTFTAGILADARHPSHGQAFIKFLSTPAAVATIKAKGMEPE